MESTTIQRDEQASDGVKSGTILPHRAKSGKASARYPITTESHLPSPYPENDRRSATLKLDSPRIMPSGDHSSSGTVSIRRKLVAIACEGRTDPADAAKEYDKLISQLNGEAGEVRQAIWFRGLLQDIYDFQESSRESIKRPPANSHQLHIETVQSIARIERKSLGLMDQWIIGGRPIGQWTGTELIAEANGGLAQQIKGLSQNRTFFISIGKIAGENQVNKSLSEKKFVEIGKKVYGPEFGKN